MDRRNTTPKLTALVHVHLPFLSLPLLPRQVFKMEMDMVKTAAHLWTKAVSGAQTVQGGVAACAKIVAGPSQMKVSRAARAAGRAEEVRFPTARLSPLYFLCTISTISLSALSPP